MLTGKEVLNIKMQENDADAANIGEYLKTLLKTLWQDGECFSGKRPFGNSGWEYDLFGALVIEKAIEGTLDSVGCLDEFDEDTGNKLIFSAIDSLFEIPEIKYSCFACKDTKEFLLFGKWYTCKNCKQYDH